MSESKKAGPKGSATFKAGGGAPAPRSLAAFDFSELQHYVDRLEESGPEDERERYRDAISMLVNELPDATATGPGAALVLAASRFAAWGGPFERVKDALTALLVSNSGYSAAKKLGAEQKLKDAANGAKGGRKPTGYDAEWIGEYTKTKLRLPSNSDTQIFKRIAAEWLADDGAPRSWTTIRDGVARAKKKKNIGKPRLSR